MSLLTLDIGRCVRTTNKFSTCEKCVEVCPVETIKISEHLPSFVPNDCVGCGGCLAACPDAAFKLDTFSPLNYIFSFLEKKSVVASCKEEIPCLAALSTEEILSLSLLSETPVVFDKAHCAECSIAKPNVALIEERIEEVNFLLEAMGVEKSVRFESVELSVEEEKVENDRRAFFAKASIKEAAKAKQVFENKVEALSEELKEHTASVEDIQSIRAKVVPDRRKLLQMAMKRAGVPTQFHNIEANDISFVSQKVIDEESCTNCQMCYRICPTGALSSDKYGGFIDFDAINCIKCQSCHDVCEPDSLTIKSVFSLKQLFKPEREQLVKFSVKRCDECGMPFVYRGGEVMCDRCRVEEEEAHALWGIKQ